MLTAPVLKTLSAVKKMQCLIDRRSNIKGVIRLLFDINQNRKSIKKPPGGGSISFGRLFFFILQKVQGLGSSGLDWILIHGLWMIFLILDWYCKDETYFPHRHNRFAALTVFVD